MIQNMIHDSKQDGTQKYAKITNLYHIKTCECTIIQQHFVQNISR